MAATYSSLVGLAVGGKYEIRRVLGAGGMGVVCEAVHLDLGKRVAVKLIDKSMKESELIVARFRREARAAGQINSEHIVDVFDVGADNRVGLYMVMEYLTGEDLQGRLERDKRVDVKTGVMIAHQIARGLMKAHEAGVIHRDLKPANVYLTERDNGQLLVKLLDFGVSKLLGDPPGSARITGSGAPIGTPLYMSPEQAEGKDDVDGRADIWSLGAVMYEALAGTPPFADRGSYHGTIVGILTSRPKLLHDAAPWVPPELARVIDAMLVHDRDARLPDAATVMWRLVEAFPAVLPDGTEKHRAVIVPAATAAVDTTGDTEVFRAMTARLRRPSAPPGSHGERASGPPTSAQDSTRTLADTSDDATRTGLATPLDVSGMQRAALGSSGGPKTAPLPPLPAPSGSGTSPAAVSRSPSATSSSSAGGVAVPATPAVIDPLPPPSEIAPETERDDALAVRAERRRRMTLASIGLAIVGVAVGGFLAGRRTTALSTAQPSAAVSAVVNATPPPPASAVPPPSTAASAPPVDTSATPGVPDPAPSARPALKKTIRPKASEPKRDVAPDIAAKPAPATETTSE